MNTETVTLNHNQATCIVERPMIGYKRFDNICTGTTHETPWTGLEWVVLTSCSLFFVVILIAVLRVFLRTPNTRKGRR